MKERKNELITVAIADVAALDRPSPGTLGLVTGPLRGLARWGRKGTIVEEGVVLSISLECEHCESESMRRWGIDIVIGRGVWGCRPSTGKSLDSIGRVLLEWTLVVCVIGRH
jgi:hypothetical protein